MKTRLARVLLLLAFLSIGTTTDVVAQSGSTRLPLPAEADAQEALKQLAKKYKRDTDAAKTPPQKSELAARMIADAEAMLDQPTLQHASFVAARRIATQAGDVPGVVRAVEALLAIFDADRLELMSDAYVEISKKNESPEESYYLLRWIEYGLTRTAVINEKTKRLTDAALSLAKILRDKDTIDEWQLRVKELRDKQEAHDALEQTRKQLDVNPLDAAANDKYGRFLAFVLHDWELAIPLLALGNDRKLAPLAERDLRTIGTNAKHLELADAWYDWAESQPDEAAKSGGKSRANHWYRATLASLSGADRLRVTTRLAEPSASKSPLASGRWVELLDRVDSQRDRMHGSWRRTNFTIECLPSSGEHLVNLPVTIESGSYELKLRLTNCKDDFGILLPGPDHPTEMCINRWWGAKSSLYTINNVEGNNDPNSVPAFKFDTKQITTLTMRVERSEGNAKYELLINDKKYYLWKGRESAVSIPNLNHRTKLAIQVRSPPAIFLSAQFRLLPNGKAKFEREQIP